MRGEAGDSGSLRTAQHAARPGNAAVRVVAFLEAAKGLLALLAASGLMALLHRDVYALGLMLVEHAHLNPAAGYPHILLDFAANASDRRLLLLALGALAYAALRFVEAWGLFFERAWAEVLAAVSGDIYVPFEIVNVVEDPGWHAWALLLLNLAVVALMLYALQQRRARAAKQLNIDPAGKG